MHQALFVSRALWSDCPAMQGWYGIVAICQANSYGGTCIPLSDRISDCFRWKASRNLTERLPAASPACYNVMITFRCRSAQRFSLPFGRQHHPNHRSTPSPRHIMRQQRLFCIATLVLIVATLVLVAADEFVLPDVKHEPTSCPICAVAQCLTTAQLPPPVLWIEPSNVHWLPPETVCIPSNELFSRLFCARTPPLLVH